MMTMSILLPVVKQALDADGIEHKELACDPEVADTAAFCERYGFDPAQSANTIVVASKTDPVRYAACVVLATCKLDVNKKVCALLDVRKASFAPMDKALELSGMEYGGVTVFGLAADTPVYVDAQVMEPAEVMMGGGNRSSKILLDPKELKKLATVQIVEGLAKAI